MITEIITFAIPDGVTLDEIVANYRRSAPHSHSEFAAKWLANVKSTPLAEV